MGKRATSDSNTTGRDVRRLASGSAPETNVVAAAKVVAAREIRWINEHDLILARALATIERERGFADDGASSAAHWAVMRGFDLDRAKELLNVGRLMKSVPETEKNVLDGVLTPQSAAVVGRLIKPTPTLPPRDEPDPAEVAAREAAEAERARKYADVAKTLPKHKLRRLVNQEKERVKHQDRVVSLVFHVKQSAKDDWLLARKLASRRAKRHLTKGEAFTLVVADYVKRRDKDGLSGRKTGRSRRMGPTSERPDDRTIPAEVRRAVMERACGHCEFPGCPNGTFLELCHIRGHADAGDREVSNLLLLCSQHHTMLDRGSLRFFERTDRGASFVDARTGEVFEPSPSRHAADVLPGAAVPVTSKPPTSKPPTSEPAISKPPAAVPEAEPGPQLDDQSAARRAAAGRDRVFSDQVTEDAPVWMTSADDRREAGDLRMTRSLLTAATAFT